MELGDLCANHQIPFPRCQSSSSATNVQQQRMFADPRPWFARSTLKIGISSWISGWSAHKRQSESTRLRISIEPEWSLNGHKTLIPETLGGSFASWDNETRRQRHSRENNNGSNGNAQMFSFYSLFDFGFDGMHTGKLKKVVG